MTTLVVGCLILAAALAGYPLVRAIRKRDAALADLREVLAAHEDHIEAAEARADVMEASAEGFAARLLQARKDRDTARTALQAKLLHEARAELLKPHEPVGSASVIEFPRRAR